MSMLYGNSKTIWEMAPEEQKVTLICLVIMVLPVIVYGIFYFIKKKKR